MKNFKLVVSYDGTRYFGWEHQPDTEMTIQGKLESVLNGMLSLPEGESVTVVGAGRTDAGVHARAMTCNVILETERTAHHPPLKSGRTGMQGILHPLRSL